MSNTAELDLLSQKKGFIGPTFSLSNRLKRAVWKLTWLLTARWTPPPFAGGEFLYCVCLEPRCLGGLLSTQVSKFGRPGT